MNNVNYYKKEVLNNSKHSFFFGFFSIFLSGIGFTIILPTIPFLMERYTNNFYSQSFLVSLVTSLYALCVFLFCPLLGTLSDKYGRRPILLICLFGSFLGYLLLGIGGSIFIILLGRIIDGITGGSIGTLFAYFSDITSTENRTKVFSLISAILGIGTILGPSIGGLLARVNYTYPMYFSALITLINIIYGIIYMPESLDKNNRIQNISILKLNPFSEILSLISIKSLKGLFISSFLIFISNGSLQAIFSLFAIDTFSLSPLLIGLLFSIMGIQDIISQGVIMPRILNKLKDNNIIILSMIFEIIGYVLILSSNIFSLFSLFILGIFIFAFGDSIFAPAYNGMLSKATKASEQGRVQGGSQALQALARVIGPLLGGKIYSYFSHLSPAILGIVLILIAIPIFNKNFHK